MLHVLNKILSIFNLNGWMSFIFQKTNFVLSTSLSKFFKQINMYLKAVNLLWYQKRNILLQRLFLLYYFFFGHRV